MRFNRNSPLSYFCAVVAVVALLTAAVTYPQGTGLVKRGGTVTGISSSGGHIAVGNAASVDNGALLYPGNNFKNVVTIEEEWTALADYENSSLLSYALLNPSSGGSYYHYNLDSEAVIKSGNSISFAQLFSGYFLAKTFGSGAIGEMNGFTANSINSGSAGVTIQRGMELNSYNESSGTIGTNYGLAMAASKQGTGAITTNKGIWVFTGNNNATNSITTDATIHIDTPYSAGTMDTHYGLLISDQNIGTTNYAIKTGAGKVTFGDMMQLTPLASPPYTCNAGNEGGTYSDTSHALCWCDGTTWTKVAGAGTCA